jgi:hypothetical protein
MPNESGIDDHVRNFFESDISLPVRRLFSLFFVEREHETGLPVSYS